MNDLTHDYNYSVPDQHRTGGRAPEPFGSEHLERELRRLHSTVDRLRARFAERDRLDFHDAGELNRSRMLLGLLGQLKIHDLAAGDPPAYTADADVPGPVGTLVPKGTLLLWKPLQGVYMSHDPLSPATPVVLLPSTARGMEGLRPVHEFTEPQTT